MDRRLFLRTLLFLVGLVVLDRGVGALLDEAFSRIRTGQASGLVNQALAHGDADFLVFGSSRAVRHVDPTRLEPVLGRGYNAGCQGHGILYARIVEALLLEGGTRARVFLLQLDPLDFYTRDLDRISVLAPFYGQLDSVDALLESISPFARWKLSSHTYRYNSMLLPILRNLIAPGRASEDGFVPLKGSLADRVPEDPDRSWRGVGPEQRVPLKQEALRHFVASSREAGIAVVAFSGPRYRAGGERPAAETEMLEWLQQAVQEEGGRFLEIDQESDPAFTDVGLYRDLAHLNARGARLFSERLAARLASGASAP